MTFEELSQIILDYDNAIEMLIAEIEEKDNKIKDLEDKLEKLPAINSRNNKRNGYGL